MQLMQQQSGPVPLCPFVSSMRRYTEVFFRRVAHQAALFKHFVRVGERAVTNKVTCQEQPKQEQAENQQTDQNQHPCLWPFPATVELTAKHPAADFAQWIRDLQSHDDSVNLWISSYQLYAHYQGVTGHLGMMFHRATTRWVEAFLRGAAWFAAYVKCLSALGSPRAVRKCIPYGDFLRNWTSCIYMRASPRELTRIDTLFQQRDAVAVMQKCSKVVGHTHRLHVPAFLTV